MKQVLERSGISHYLLLESEDKATFFSVPRGWVESVPDAG